MTTHKFCQMLVSKMNETPRIGRWSVGAAALDITPGGSPYLCGYPNVQRDAEGVNDPLLASAACVESPDGSACVLLACDILNLPCDLVQRARQRIAAQLAEKTDAAPGSTERVMITATHTHSGPLAVEMVTNRADPLVPEPDPGYLVFLEEAIVNAASAAIDRRRPAVLSSGIASSAELGTNRRDPAGRAIPRLPVFIAKDMDTAEPIAVIAVCSMHPTVLHEDSKLISGDFPGLARRWLQQNAIGPACPLVYHMGASGNQSPRHVVQANTMSEAERLGERLGRQIAGALGVARPLGVGVVRCGSVEVDLPVRDFPSLEDAERAVVEAEAHLEKLHEANRPRAEVRTAEVDTFGCRKTLALAKAAEAGWIGEAVRQRMPAQVQVIRLGEHALVGWPGEVFVEFALDVMRHDPHATIITLANGELHGYLVTQEAIDAGGYEAAHGLFQSPRSGELLVEATKRLLNEIE